MTALGCPEVLPHLESYRRGDCSEELALLLDDHLARCPACRRRLARLRQLTAMLEAWRPRPVPSELKVAVAEAVSSELGAAARQAFPRRAGAGRRRGRPWPRLTGAQRAANMLAVVALAFLGAAILWRMYAAGDPAAGPTPAAPAPAAGPMRVRLSAAGQRRAEVRRLVAETLGADEAAAERFLSRLPRTLAEGLPRAAAAALTARLEAAGAAVELREATRGGPAP
jgi:ribosomal protein L7/L12